MPKVKVWNLNQYPYKETFKGDEIVIPPQSFIEMEYYDAHEFRGSYSPIKRDHDNQPLPQSFKMIRIEEGDAVPAIEDTKNQCVACKYKASDEKDLMSHIKETHAHQAAVDKEAEAEIEKRKSAKKAG
jgi:hypothetical protein